MTAARTVPPGPDPLPATGVEVGAGSRGPDTPVDPAPTAQDFDFDDDDDGACQTCGGDGIEECDDAAGIEGCYQPDCDGRYHKCTNCRGSGLARDQWFW